MQCFKSLMSNNSTSCRMEKASVDSGTGAIAWRIRLTPVFSTCSQCQSVRGVSLSRQSNIVVEG